MDLLDFRDKYGKKALVELAAQAGIERSYLPQIMGGFRRIKFERAQRLVDLNAELDVIALQAMADRIRQRKKRERKEMRAAKKLKANGKKKAVTA
jgi:hypothetical protein